MKWYTEGIQGKLKVQYRYIQDTNGVLNGMLKVC